jgi:predicted mannosyl-3-phosphoglycerate phosphatase (HAD superfamily)
LKGVEKLKFIQEKWGSNFIYIGDSNDDIPIFKIAKDAFKIINIKIINVKSVYQTN